MPLSPFLTRLVLLLVFPVSLLPGCNRETPKQLTLYAVGDVMLGRHIGKVMTAQGADLPLQSIAPVLQQGDVVFGNLEAVIAPDDAVPFFPDKPYNFHASAAAASALKKAGFHVMSLANNHALDYGADALLETKRLLALNGIRAFGAGKDLTEARQPVIIMKNGIRIGFLGYGIAHSRDVYATTTRPGIASLVREHIRDDITALRPRVDLLVVSLHWGIEYESMPDPKQQVLAHEIIDWGADLLAGHHPHVMQGVEVYKSRVIAYSLGNFVFDQKGNGTDRSFILASTFDRKDFFSSSIIPLERTKRYFPAVALGNVRTGMIEDIKKISLPLNSGSRGVVRAGLREQGRTEEGIAVLLRTSRE